MKCLGKNGVMDDRGGKGDVWAKAGGCEGFTISLFQAFFDNDTSTAAASFITASNRNNNNKTNTITTIIIINLICAINCHALC